MALTLRPLKPGIYPAGVFPIPDGDRIFCVGREPGNDLVVDHASVSARHARIEVAGEAGVEVVDCGSSNGTFVNGLRVERRQIRPGDLLRFATAEFRVSGIEGETATRRLNGGAAPVVAPGSGDDGERAAMKIAFQEEREALKREISRLIGENGRFEAESTGLREKLAAAEARAIALGERVEEQGSRLRHLQRDLEEAAARESRLQASLSEARREVIEREGVIAGLRYEIGTKEKQVRQLEEQRSGLQRICDDHAAAGVRWQESWADLSTRHEAAIADRLAAEGRAADLLARLGDLEVRLLSDWQAWIESGSLPERPAGGPAADPAADATTLFQRIEATAAAIRGQLDLIEPIWHQYGDGVQAELAQRTDQRRADLAGVETEIVRRREALAAIEADLAQFRETMDAEVRRAQGLSRKGIEVEIPERFESMVIAKDREQEIYRALIERLEVLDLLLEGYRGSRKLREVAQELTAFRNRLVAILESGGVRPFEIATGTFLTPKHRREVQVLSRKGWGTRQYSETPFQPGEVVKVVRPGYRVGEGDAAVILRKVEVLIRGGED